jgi:ATP-dependent DNA helicase RecQ
MEFWGFDTFRDGQWEAIEALVEGRDALTIMPTGGGKSVCYQLSALLLDGCVLVVSPLVSLMEDQVASLNGRGIEAAYINSTLSRRVIDQRLTDAEYDRYELLYVTPERLTSELFTARADRLNVSLVAVDEAHCVSEWGHDFRPAYLEIADACAALGRPPILAVTATATPEVRDDISKQLELREPRVIVKGFDRPNLVWSVFHEADKATKVYDILEAVDGSGLIYAGTRRRVEQWKRRLEDRGITAAGYHAGMQDEARLEAQLRWVNDEVRVMVATNAFGMGIDKPDVRFVIHVALPGSVEAYYQEAGRAGRDGRTAYAVLLAQEGDEELQNYLIASSHPGREQIHAVYDTVCNLAQIPTGSQPDEPIPVNIRAVQKVTDLALATIRSAVDLLEREEVWTLLHLRGRYGLIRFRDSIEALRRYADQLTNASLAEFVRTVLRTVYADAASRWYMLDVGLLERRTDLPRERLLKGMNHLEERGLIAWYPPDPGTVRVQFLHPRTRSIPLEMEPIEKARERAEQKLQRVVRYAWSPVCRRRFLLGYFGQDHPRTCGRCDRCMDRHPTVSRKEVSPRVEYVFREIEADGFVTRWDQGTERALQWLIENGHVRAVDPVEGRYQVETTRSAAEDP